MIKVNLKQIMSKHKININQLSKNTGISRKALTLLYNYNESENPPVSVQYNTINILCEYFHISVDDLIKFEHNQKDFDIIPLAFNIGKESNINLFLFIYTQFINNKKMVKGFITATKLIEYLEGKEKKYTIPRSLSDSNDLDVTEQIIYTPAFKQFSFEIIENENINKISKYFEQDTLYSLIKKNEIKYLTDFEVTSLMKSFNKAFLAELTARTFEYLLDDDSSEESISLNWNFGEYSWMNTSRFHFEYSKMNTNIISLDDDDISLFKDSILPENRSSYTKPLNTELNFN